MCVEKDKLPTWRKQKSGRGKGGTRSMGGKDYPLTCLFSMVPAPSSPLMKTLPCICKRYMNKINLRNGITPDCCSSCSHCGIMRISCGYQLVWVEGQLH